MCSCLAIHDKIMRFGVHELTRLYNRSTAPENWSRSSYRVWCSILSVSMFVPKVIVFGHERSTATATKREGVPVVANSDGVTEAEEGLVTEYSVLLPCAVSAKLWSALSGLPAVVIAGEAEWQHLRIKNGKLSICFYAFLFRVQGFASLLLRDLGEFLYHTPHPQGATVRTGG